MRLETRPVAIAESEGLTSGVVAAVGIAIVPEGWRATIPMSPIGDRCDVTRQVGTGLIAPMRPPSEVLQNFSRDCRASAEAGHTKRIGKTSQTREVALIRGTDTWVF